MELYLELINRILSRHLYRILEVDLNLNACRRDLCCIPSMLKVHQGGRRRAEQHDFEVGYIDEAPLVGLWDVRPARCYDDRFSELIDFVQQIVSKVQR